MRQNPFIYGRSLMPDEFVGRRRQVDFIFSRMKNGESAAIIGEPHSGKTSLLSYVASPGTRRQQLGENYPGFFFAQISCLLVPAKFGPCDFWERAVAPLSECAMHQRTSQLVEEARASQFAPHLLQQLFLGLDQANLHLVLLIDEFDIMLYHPNFTVEFFACLRELASLHRSLSLVTASRLDVSRMTARSRELLAVGSPFFNIFAEVAVGALEEEEIAKLLQNAQDRSGVRFDDRDRGYLVNTGGRHPYSYQVAGSALFDAVAAGLTSRARYETANEAFYERVAPHFDEVWDNLDDGTRKISVMLALADAHGSVGGLSFSFGGMERTRQFLPELRRLEKAGLAHKAPAAKQSGKHRKELLQGEQWRLSSKGFIWWVSDVVLSEAREASTYDEWLRNQRNKGFLTQGQWETAKGWATKIPISVSTLMNAFVSELLKAAVK